MTDRTSNEEYDIIFFFFYTFDLYSRGENGRRTANDGRSISNTDQEFEESGKRNFPRNRKKILDTLQILSIKNISSRGAHSPVPEKLHVRFYRSRTAAKPVKIQQRVNRLRVDSEVSSNVDHPPSPPHSHPSRHPSPPRQPREQPDAAGRVVLMGVFAVNTLKFALGWGGDGRATKRERERE